MLDDDVLALASEANQGILATLMPDGEPQASIVWPHADQHHILVTTSTGRQIYRNVQFVCPLDCPLWHRL